MVFPTPRTWCNISENRYTIYRYCSNGKHSLTNGESLKRAMLSRDLIKRADPSIVRVIVG